MKSRCVVTKRWKIGQCMFRCFVPVATAQVWHFVHSNLKYKRTTKSSYSREYVVQSEKCELRLAQCNVISSETMLPEGTKRRQLTLAAFFWVTPSLTLTLSLFFWHHIGLVSISNLNGAKIFLEYFGFQMIFQEALFIDYY